MKILVVGSGGREHALVWKLAQSKRAEIVYCAPGNAGISRQAHCLDIAADDIDGLLSFARSERIDLTVVGPEAPLTAGIVDVFRAHNLKIIGPGRQASRLEASKVFSKELMRRCGVPTADFAVFSEPDTARAFVREQKKPRVIKADGLCAGKGVLICPSLAEQEQAIEQILVARIFGDAGARIVIEEMLDGPELSLLVLTDGTCALNLATSQDHKRALDDDKGGNTGGMGAYSPAPVVSDAQLQDILKTCVQPIITHMSQQGTPYQGILYAGLMLTARGPQVLEFNVRFGDPETQAVLPRLKNDLLEVFLALTEQRLDTVRLEWDPRSCVCVVMASAGYPGSYQSGKRISGLTAAEQLPDTAVFHAGTRLQNAEIVTSGGRVLGVSGLGNTVDEAISVAYRAVREIAFEGAHFRRDIAKKARGC